jgi:Na+:H+ antiporter, NhaA family
LFKRSRLANQIATALRRLLGGEAAAGVLLILAAAAAMVLANSPLVEAYHHAFEAPLPWTPLAKLATWHAWISDGLMGLFFFAVGLEIKREVLDGELSTPAKRRLPVLAAVAGMAVPALIYLAVSGQAELQRGWAIPAATDIAFALGVLGLLGKRVPPALRMFLLTVAIVDDLGAVVIIAFVYTDSISVIWLTAALGCLIAMAVLNRANRGGGWSFTSLALLTWLCAVQSGVHPTVAAVAAALTIPLRLDSRGDSLLLRMEHALVPWNAYLIVPLFGFANAGVSLSAGGPHGIAAPLPLAIALGLFLGKQAGIFGMIYVADRLGLAERPRGASWLQLWGMALLCGVGFTMSLFISALAFPDQAAFVEQAKLGVLAGSLASAVAGFAVLRWAGRTSAP